MRIATRFLIGALLMLPVITSAATAEELRAQAQELLNRIAALQAQLGAAPGTPTGSGITVDSSPCPLIGRSLKVGSSGDDVTRLQQFLARDTSVYPEGQVTGYYGALTEAAVKRWQVKYNIVSSGTAASTGYGVVGPRTAAAISLQCSIYGGGGGGGGAPTVGGFIQVTPISGQAPLSVKVAATVNTVNSCGGATYSLDYGDGTVPSQIVVPNGNCQQMTQALSHTYVYGGNYLITLSAGSHRTTASVTVFGGSAPTQTPAQADYISASPLSGTSPLAVTFTGLINGAGTCNGGSYTLQFGDGKSTPLTYDSASCNPRTFSVSHEYTGGNYTAAMYRGNGAGVVIVGSPLPIAVNGSGSGSGSSNGPMTITPGFNGNPLAIQLQFNGGCSTYTLSWGDGSTSPSGSCASSTMTFTHTYGNSGSYTVTLTRGSQTDTASVVIQ